MGEWLPNLSVVAQDPNTVWKPTKIANWYGRGERVPEVFVAAPFYVRQAATGTTRSKAGPATMKSSPGKAVRASRHFMHPPSTKVDSPKPISTIMHSLAPLRADSGLLFTLQLLARLMILEQQIK